ncbi:hypothetical protein STXM2123_897 [Streptomyces sp. F-3]|nr:hypothetical protein STXM2123_897 [Streptomyces sp. F-3]
MRVTAHRPLRRRSCGCSVVEDPGDFVQLVAQPMCPASHRRCPRPVG